MRTVNNSLTLWLLCLLLGSSCKQAVRRSAAGRWWVSYRHTPQRWLTQTQSDGPPVQNTPPKRQGLTFNHPALSSFWCGSNIKILSRCDKHIYKKSWLYTSHFKGMLTSQTVVHIKVCGYISFSTQLYKLVCIFEWRQTSLQQFPPPLATHNKTI